MHPAFERIRPTLFPRSPTKNSWKATNPTSCFEFGRGIETVSVPSGLVTKGTMTSPETNTLQIDGLGDFVDSFVSGFKRKDQAKLGATNVHGRRCPKKPLRGPELSGPTSPSSPDVDRLTIPGKRKRSRAAENVDSEAGPKDPVRDVNDAPHRERPSPREITTTTPAPITPSQALPT